MYQISISSKIEEFLNTEKERISKINSKIDIVNNKIQKVKGQINSLEDECVKCDLDDNVEGKEKTEKNITTLRRELENLEGQRAAYERAKDNYKGSEKVLTNIQKDAAKEVKKVNGLFQDKVNEKKALEDSILQIQQKIRNANSEIESLRIQPEWIASEIVRIEDYIYGKGVLDARVKADKTGWNTKAKLVLSDLKNM
jgi:hypothetical protein